MAVTFRMDRTGTAVLIWNAFAGTVSQDQQKSLLVFQVGRGRILNKATSIRQSMGIAICSIDM
jgi:hypothetical protein